MKDKNNTGFKPPVSPLGTPIRAAKDKAEETADSESKKSTRSPRKKTDGTAKKMPATNRKRTSKQSSADTSDASVNQDIYRSNGLTEDDVAMIFELGYESELGKLIGADSLKRLKNEHIRHARSVEVGHFRTSFGYRGEEYTDFEKRDAVKAAYVHDRKTVIIRMCLTLLLSLLLCFIELPELFEVYLSPINAISPLILPAVALVAFLLTALLSFRQIRAGFYSLFRFAPTPYSVLTVLSVPVLIYDLITLFSPISTVRINFPVALVFLLFTVCDVFRLCSELRVFRIISAPGEKTVLSATTPQKKKIRHGNRVVKIFNDDLGKKMYHVNKTNQTVGFFRRFNDLGTASRTFGFLLIFALASATLIAIVDSIVTSSFFSALSAFMTAVSVCMPATAVFSFFFPLCAANHRLTKRNCALVGEESVAEYDDEKTVIFQDTDLFSTQTNAEIAIQKENELHRDLYLAAVLFRKLGGTLATVGQPPLKSRTDPSVTIVRLSDDGVEAVLDNRFHMLVGTQIFMERNGISVPEESTDRALLRAENAVPLYVAVDGLLKLRYEIEYGTDPEFEDLVRAFAESGTAVAINSYDPNLSNDFVQACRHDQPIEISVVKIGQSEDTALVDLADTGAVALGRTSDILYPVKASRAVTLSKRFGFRMQTIASLIGSAGVLLLTLFGTRTGLGVLPIIGYHLLWITVSLIATITEIRKAK